MKLITSQQRNAAPSLPPTHPGIPESGAPSLCAPTRSTSCLLRAVGAGLVPLGVLDSALRIFPAHTAAPDSQSRNPRARPLDRAD